MVITRLINTEKRTIDVDNRTVTFCISDETEDRHGTIIKVAGWDFSDYEKNNVVLWGHKSYSGDPDDVLGTGRVYVENNKVMGEVTFETEAINPKAEKVLQKVIAGTIKMTSVGFDPLEWRWGHSDLGEDPDKFYYARQSLLEFSIVPIGSNPNALIEKSIEATKQLKEESKREAIQNPIKSKTQIEAIRTAYGLQ